MTKKIIKKEVKDTEKKPKVETEIVTISDVEQRIEKEETKYITYPRAQLDQIKDVYAKGASDVEFANFILVSVRTGLDIFKKQIYLIKRWDSRLERDVFTPQAGIDGFRSTAERTNAYAGNDDPTYEAQGDKPTKATVTVYKMVGGVRCPFTGSARWNEYFPGEKLGFMWKQKPFLMLGKCAEALALRKAFPNIFAGLNESAEMDMALVEGKKDDKQKKGVELIKETISKYKSVAECDEYIEKITKSDKYTDEQKKILLEIANSKKSELIDSEKK